jgi:hypothetical protein
MNGSSPSARERRRGERASEAGSSVAKPRDRWRVPTKPVGSRERVDLGAPVEGRRFGSGKSVSLTRERRKRSWLLESVRGSPTPGGYGARQGASEVGRQPRAWPKKPRRGGTATEAVPGSGTRRKANRAVHGSAEAGGAPSSARPAGVGLSQDGPTSHGRTRPPLRKEDGEGEASCGQRSASYAPGSRAVHGCSCRESVAEVGERHLLRAIEGSREANRGCTE